MNLKTKYMLVFIILLIVTCCILYKQQVTNLSSVAGVKINDITKVSLYYGRPGQKGVVITDKNALENITGKLEKLKLIKMKDQPAIVGYYQAGKLYKNDDQVAAIIFGNPIEINGTYYRVVRGNIKASEIDEIINKK